MRMKRLSILGYLLVAGLVGCVAPRSDLSALCRWQEIEGEAVAVATADRMLPVVTDEKQENRWAAWFLCCATAIQRRWRSTNGASTAMLPDSRIRAASSTQSARS